MNINAQEDAIKIISQTESKRMTVEGTSNEIYTSENISEINAYAIITSLTSNPLYFSL